MKIGEVHLYWLDLCPQSLGDLHSLLGEAEQARAARFRFDRDRNRYVAAHGQVRLILSRYAGVPPEGLEYSEGAAGKPSLVASELEFNLSHSQEVGLLAVTFGVPVGVDVEHCRENMSEMEIARRFFTVAEVAGLEALGKHQRRRNFFRIWTAKEAFLKATGEGLTREPDSFEVVFDGDGRIVGLRAEAGWSLRELDAPEEYAAALCVCGEMPTVMDCKFSF